jgi:hypothetical protein
VRKANLKLLIFQIPSSQASWKRRRLDGTSQDS